MKVWPQGCAMRLKYGTNSLAYRRRLAKSGFDEMLGGLCSCEQIIPQGKIASQRCRKSTAGSVSRLARNFSAAKNGCPAVFIAHQIIRRIKMSASDDHIARAHIMQS